MDYAGRRDRLAARLPALEVEALLVSNLPNVRYLTGFTGSNGQLLLGEREGVLLTDSRYEEQARHEVPDLSRQIYRNDLPAAFGEACRAAGIGRVAFEAAEMTFDAHRQLSEKGGVELVPTTEEVEQLRWTKEPAELALIERAQAITDDAFDELTGTLVEGMTERAAAWALERAMREGGADGIAFEPIVAFGENAAEPHHHPTDRTLRRGDIVKLDFGCTVQGYHSDMTRTVAFGEPSAELREIHALVFRAQQAGVDAIRPGIVCGDADEAARSVIREAGHGERFGHSLGHGIGLEVHEEPSLRHGSKDVAPEGTVVTVEPGVYVPGVGGVRIEDMVVVTADGARLLPRSPRELLVVEKGLA